MTHKRTHPTDAASAVEFGRLARGDHSDPHQLLGAHETDDGVVIRVLRPDARRAEVILDDGRTVPAERSEHEAVLTALVPGRTLPLRYRIRLFLSDDAVVEVEDPYRFLPSVGEMDQYLFAEGTHWRLWGCLGAHPRTLDGVDGVAFAVWAPNARRVSVVGDFCGWDGRLYPMRQLGISGVFELFVPGVRPGALYKYEIKTRSGMLRLKTDPLAFAMEAPPGTASRVVASEHQWGDAAWMAARATRDPVREPLAVYELHLGSWMRVPEEGNRPLSYREIAPRLVAHVKRLGFTHVELLPVMEHPFTGSWGYQVSGYYAPTARHGAPDDFRYFVDYCHQHDVGVILDWVPAHFPRDDFALRRFDGTALYEHADPRRGEHPDWGTLIFHYARHEVRAFLLSNALYWLQEFHVDGLRVDAVASMLYLDYSRKEGEWVPNPYGGREDLDAIAFLRALNDAVREDAPGCITVAEESTAWPGVTRPTAVGGLGFTFKWNMGWMHDTLAYFVRNPVHRRHHQDQLTFAMLYEHSERFVMPLSHDEVVHGKGSLLAKMPGDPWQRFANLRLLYTYMYTRPGKQLLFMGSELAPLSEWNHDASLDWHLVQDPLRAGLARFFEDLGRLYREAPALWRSDPDPEGFAWIDCADRENSVVAYLRRTGDELLIVVLNFTPVPREHYRVGTPVPGRHVCRFSSDDPRYGGSQFEALDVIDAEPTPFHGHQQSLVLRLPPLAALVLTPTSES